MSQTPPPTPPPLPPPVPVLPVDAYGLPPHAMGPTRPGLVTAMGVTSIVVAGISILAGIYAALALIGFLIASLVNMFLRSPAMYWILTYVGVLIFVGLTAYDTQKLKQVAIETAGDSRMAARLAVTGALILYLDFINLFLLLLRILGNRSDD